MKSGGENKIEMVKRKRIKIGLRKQYMADQS